MVIIVYIFYWIMFFTKTALFLCHIPHTLHSVSAPIFSSCLFLILENRFSFYADVAGILISSVIIPIVSASSASSSARSSSSSVLIPKLFKVFLNLSAWSLFPISGFVFSIRFPLFLICCAYF